MLQRAVGVLLFATSLLAIPAAGQGAEPAKSPHDQLAGIAWFVGGSWVADVKDPDDGKMTHIESRITWAPNNAAIEFTTSFNGKTHYNGFYAYDPGSKAIKFYYTSEEGQLTIGTATPDADGKTLHQEFDTIQPSGKTGHLKSTIVREGMTSINSRSSCSRMGSGSRC